MSEVISAEWLKLRSVRSTYFALGFVVLAVVFGTVVTALMTADFDASPAAEQAHFGRADMSPMILPFVQLAMATLAALAITSEYGTGMIRTSLVATPQRGRLLAAKVAVVAAVSTIAGLLAAFGMALAAWLITSDRPAPLRPWDTFGDAVPMALASGATITVVALVALGLGLALRSTAATLVTVTGLVFVLPGVAAFLPAPMNEWLMSVSLLALPPQLAGSDAWDLPAAGLGQAGAATALAGYVVLALGAGWLALRARDA